MVTWRSVLALATTVTLAVLIGLGTATAEGGYLQGMTAHGTSLPDCVYGAEPTPLTAYEQWQYTLLDTRFKLPAEYVPPDLVAVDHTVTGGRPGDQVFMLRSLVVADLGRLMRDARAAGVPLAIQSAYRSYAYQESTFAYWVAHQGEEQALLTSARAGHSEHQLGTVVDFRSEDGPPAWELDDWAREPAGAWLADNARHYGFVMSYPRGAQKLSCYAYEPWHYRYVGVALASEMHEQGLVPRVFMWRFAVTQAGLDD